jgi:metal transporter CNNM
MIFGEIIPQAICSRHGLFIGSHTIFIVKFFRVIFLPFAFPIAWLLNKVLGRDIGQVYSQAEIKGLM